MSVTSAHGPLHFVTRCKMCFQSSPSPVAMVSSVGMCEFFVIGNIVFRVLVKHVVDGWFTAASSRISQPSQRVAEGILAQRRAWQASNTNKVDTIPRSASLVGNEMAEVGATD